MLKKPFRIGRKDLERFFSAKGARLPDGQGSASGGKLKSSYFKGALLTARARRNNLAFNRFAFVVSGPKTRASHLRNLARRRMAEAVHATLKTSLPGLLGSGWDVVLFLKLNGRAVPPFSALKEDIKHVISKNIL